MDIRENGSEVDVGEKGTGDRTDVAVVGVRTPRVTASTYAAKKTVAQGMMDIALITANANQLRYLLEFQRNSPTFYLSLVLIIISLVLQVIDFIIIL
jgi:hypothetical protein